jgi:GDP-4-dehydro-6-deoxy-D-mannose reductase
MLSEAKSASGRTNILITGAGGFVGTYLIKELQQNPDNKIFACVYKSTSDITALLPTDQILEGDLTSYDFTLDLVKRSAPSVIFHLAALSVVGNSPENAIKILNNNTAISYNVFEAVKNAAPTCRVVAICSANVYGAVKDTSHPLDEYTPMRPLNPYAISKVTQEMLALQYHLAYGLNTIILRPFNHTGPGQTTDFVIPRLAQQFASIEKGQQPPLIEVGNLDSVRDFTDVRDMVKGYVLASQSGVSGETYNLGSGHGYSIREILDILQELSSVKVEIKVNENLVRSADVPVLIASADKFKSATGWSPSISLKTTILDILNYYRG